MKKCYSYFSLQNIYFCGLSGNRVIESSGGLWTSAWTGLSTIFYVALAVLLELFSLFIGDFGLIEGLRPVRANYLPCHI